MPLSYVDQQIIRNGEWLSDKHINLFSSILEICSDYSPQDVVLLQCPNWIKSVPQGTKYIQILYSADDLKTNRSGHWVCSFYDGKSSIYIYDSMNYRRLHSHHKIYLEKLFPFYPFDKKPIKFPKVQSQTNANDCGVFAIAFAISILFDIKPDNVIYDLTLMRSHLLNIFNLERIEHFPIVKEQNKEINIIPLHVLQERKRLAGKRRKLREEETTDQHAKRLNYQKEFKRASTEQGENTVKSKEKKTKECNKSYNISSIVKVISTNESLNTKTQNSYTHCIISPIIKMGSVDEPLNVKNQNTSVCHTVSSTVKSSLADKFADTTNKKDRNIKEINKDYYNRHKDDLLRKKKEYYIRNTDKILQKNKDYYENMKRNNHKQKIGNKIVKKYKELSRKFDNIKMKNSYEIYIKNICKVIDNPSITESRLEAENIVKWCMHVRDKYIFQLKKMLKFTKQKVKVCLTRAESCPTSDLKDIIAALCGQSKHTATSEPYFAETAYYFFNNKESIVINADGQAVNILPLIKSESKKLSKTWHCCGYLCKVDLYLINTLRRYFAYFQSCTLKDLHKFFLNAHDCTNKILMNTLDSDCSSSYNDKMGHPHVCYINYESCKSTFLSVEILSSHFPEVRYIKRLIYDLLSIDKKLYNLDSALNECNINILRGIVQEAQKNVDSIKENIVEINLNEDKIISEHHFAFKSYTQRIIDTPSKPCVSCEKLCYGKDVTKITILPKLAYTSSVWNLLMDYNKCKRGDICFICRYCQNKIRLDIMPPTCVLNKLDVYSVPKEIETLNDYERILIQRAKAFQTVVRMGTVMNKNLPHKHMVQKVKGRTFHLPLPLEETFKKIAPTKAAINLKHELYIIVRGIPTKSKVVWENLVDTEKIWKALSWLKNNNPLYSKIELPADHGDLLSHPNLCDTEFQANLDCISEKIENEDNNDDRNNKPAALLTQMSESDPYYEQFTIYPIYEKKLNRSATELYQMVKIQDRPLNFSTKDLDVKCFPDLFPYGINGQHEDRSVRLTDFEFIKSRLMSKHSQFRLNIQYLFYLLHDNNMRQLNAGIFHKMNVTNPREKYTAATYLEKLTKQQLETNLNTIFARLRNTPQYWMIPRSQVNCMVRHYGPATWFLTLNPSEWLWNDMIEYLRDINSSKTTKVSDNELIASDPVSVSRFIKNKLDAIIAFILAPDNPIGEVSHYFVRREYQGRGTQHFHILIWVKDAPIIGVSSNQEVIDFILKYVTCRIPDRNVSPQLYRRVNTHQRHVHNSYCMRSKKTKYGTTRVCRFGFSRPVTDTFKLKDVAVTIARRKQLRSKNRLYDLPRSKEEANINDYNPVILTAWEGNMDIQFVGEKSTLLTWYTTKYVSKPETSHLTDTIDVINSNKSLRSNLWNIGMRMLHHRECGALEAADSLLGIPLHFTDSKTTIRWLDVNIIRNRKLKSRKEIEALDTESTDIFCASFIDTYYPNRPEKLESLCLYDMAKWYDVTRVKPSRFSNTEYHTIDKNLYLKRRKRSYLINHFNYNVDTQPEKYYFALLILFKPWRDTIELKNEQDTYAEAFLSLQSQLAEALQYHEKMTDIQKAIDFLKVQATKIMAEDDDKEKNFGISSLECVPILSQLEDAMKDFQDIGNKYDKQHVTQMISNFNPDQKRIFDKVTNTISSDNEIIRLYVSGEGGTGKSFLIKTIRCWIKQNLGKDTAVTAPTGIAAFNIDGLTIHRLFQLPVEHGHTANYTPLSDAALKIVREDLKNVVLIIIDEISMISNVTLTYIHLRLTEICDTGDTDDGWFGKKHMLLFGDLLQLPPVHEEPAFIKLSKIKVEKYIGALGAFDLWYNLFSYDELRINMRQQNDHLYGDILSRIRIGMILASDVKLLLSRRIQFQTTEFESRVLEICDYISNLPPETVCLLPTCEKCDVLNSAMLNRIPSEEIKLIAYDTTDCPTYLKKKVSKILANKDDEDISRTAGLAKIITIKIGAIIMIRRNIDVSLGLVNGTMAKVLAVTRSVERNDDNVEKLKIVLSSGIEHTIERVSVKFEVMDKVFVIRKQFPISLSYGVTIHKSQGLSLSNAIVDVGNSIFTCGQTYVALSRVRTMEGLHIINFDPASIKASDFAITEYNRLRAKYRPDLTEINVSKSRARKIIDTHWTVPKNVSECQETTTDKVLDTLSWKIRGISNIDNVSCYANAVMQCILHCSLIRDELLLRLENKDVLKVFINNYTSTDNKTITVNEVRRFVNEKYTASMQQDAAEFITDLCEKSNCIKSLVEHHINTTICCTTCNYTSNISSSNCILSLVLPVNMKKSYTLQEIVDNNFSKWEQIDGPCNFCHNQNTSRLHKIDISWSNRILILQLLLFQITNNEINKITNCCIKAIPTTKLRIGDEIYKATSAMFHHGDTVTEGITLLCYVIKGQLGYLLTIIMFRK